MRTAEEILNEYSAIWKENKPENAKEAFIAAINAARLEVIDEMVENKYDYFNSYTCIAVERKAIDNLKKQIK